MTKVLGYYNTVNGIFLGPVTAPREQLAGGGSLTPRHIEGICFGEFDTDTQEFVPHTNPMHIPKGMIMTRDDDFDAKGNVVTDAHVSGIEEDKGADIARKGFLIGTKSNMYRNSNVETRDEGGKVYPDQPKAQSTIKKEAPVPRVFTPADMPKDVDFNNLF